MVILINGIKLREEQISAELARHSNRDDPNKFAALELALRELMRQKAAELDICTHSEDATIRAVLAKEIKLPVLDEETYLSFYQNNTEAFMLDTVVEVSHILFSIKNIDSKSAVHSEANAILDQVLNNPASFSHLANQYSDCPSGKRNGLLGPTARGVLPLALEEAIFSLEENMIYPHLVETKFGIHIIRSGRKIPASMVPFEQTKIRIAEYMHNDIQQQAIQQYLRTLIAKANIEGLDIE